MKAQVSTFAVTFIARKSASKKRNQLRVYARVTVNGKRIEISTQRDASRAIWDSKSCIAKGRSVEAHDLNTFLEGFRNKLYQAHTKVFNKTNSVTVTAVKNEFLGLNESTRCVLELFNQHNQQVKEKVGFGFAAATLQRYKTTLKHLSRFVGLQYTRSEYTVGELDYDFISNFEHYLKTVVGIGNNTTVKYIKNFKKIVRIAIKRGYIMKDPFIDFKIGLKPVKRIALTQSEVDIVRSKNLHVDRLNQVRDLFIFSCYTGLAYSDVMKLTEDNIIIGVDGEKWLKVDRTKTNTTSHIPLLPVPLKLIERYDSGSDYLFPRISNQCMNSYLKEIADLCGIKKNLHFHLARHTFATTITLSNGVSIESVSAMLGHSDIKTTQIYSIVVEEKICEEMNDMRKKL